MPNWCYSNIEIKHYDKDRLKELYYDIIKWKNKSCLENGFDRGQSEPCWLGNIVLNSGISETTNNVSCRGSVLEINFNGESIHIETETAWGPMMKMWSMIVNKYLPAAEITFTAEENNMGIYITNDEAYKDLYIVDSYGDLLDYESNYEASKEYVVGILQELLETEESDIEILLEMLDDSDCSEEIAIHKWETVQLDEID